MSKFVDALEACVREAAARVAATSHVWHDHCVSPGEKTRVQVEQLAPLMDEMRVEWGYPGALWCAFWSAVRRAIRLRSSLTQFSLTQFSLTRHPSVLSADARRAVPARVVGSLDV